MTPRGEIALNPYKQDIFPHRRVIKSALVSYIIDAIKGALKNKFRMKLSMKANLKIVLSALALAALVAAPIVAKSYILPLFFASSAAPADWKEYENPAYSFAVHFPVDPTFEATTFRTADGRSLEAHSFSVEQDAGTFKVTVVEMPGEQTGEEALVVKEAAKNVAEGGVTKFDITHSIGSIYGRQLGIAGANGGYSYVALFYYKQRLYQIEGKALVAGGQAEVDAMRFQQSLDLTSD
jgi:hypothetical protein